MGHTMWVGGDATKPWVWCTACGAYSTKVVKKLAQQCPRTGNMHAVNTLMKGFEPQSRAKTLKSVHNNDEDKKALATMANAFAHPATTEDECIKVLCAIVRLHDHKDKRLGPKWEAIRQKYNIRVTDKHRMVVAKEMRLAYAAATHVQACTHQRNQIPLTSPPRKMAWADLGGRPTNTQDSKHDNRANAIAAARIVCTHTYWTTYRRDKKLELSCAASSGVNMRPTSHALNGLVIPTTSMRRSRFEIPESCSNRVDDPIPTTATQLTEEQMHDLLRYRPRKREQNQTNNTCNDPHSLDSPCTIGLAPNADSEDEVFGHGGSLD